MSTPGPSQARGVSQRDRRRHFKKQHKNARPQPGVGLPERPPKRKPAPAGAAGAAGPAPPNSASAPRPVPAKRRKQAAAKPAAKPAAPEPRREVLNRRIVAGPPFHYVAQVGQGTYGKVYKAVDTTTQKVLAMKRLRLESQREGLPVTAAREIKLLQMLSHDNIVRLNEIVVSRNDIYMAFDYIEHDLAGLLLNKSLAISPANVKSVIGQTTAALAFLHARMIMHRDIKGSNILVTADGVIKLADFGLARGVDVVRPDARYTNRVITLWYRPPELLLGADRYGPEVDEWGIGCLLVELLLRAPLFHGKDEVSQLQALYDVLGVPPAHEWPQREQLPWFALFDSLPMAAPSQPKTLAGVLADAGVPAASTSPAFMDLAQRLLAFDPQKRLSADAALQHAYFSESPPAEPLKLALVDEWHDWEAKQRTRASSSDAPPPLPSQPQPQPQSQSLPHSQPSQSAQQRSQQAPRRKAHDYRKKN